MLTVLPPSLLARSGYTISIDFEHANALLCSIDWKELLPLSDPNASWTIFKELFLRIMMITIPRKVMYPPTNSSLPWINCSFLNHIKIRNSIFSSAKRTGSPSLWAKYRSYRNKGLAYLRHVKSKFFYILLTSPLHSLFVLLLILPKLKTSSSSPSDYRPISLLSLPSKILECHIFNYLYEFCSTHNILSICQFDFRLGFSTETCLLSIVNSWFSSLDLKNAVCAVFFDLTKAFESVPHKPLLDSLSSLHLPPLLIIDVHTCL